MGKLDEFVTLLKGKSFIKSIMNDLHGEVFAIGGVVRDLILNKTNKDIDLIVRNVSVDTLIDKLRTFGRVDLVGKSFGVVKFIDSDGLDYDIALPRKEKPNGEGGYKGFEVQSDKNLPIGDDLVRRDLKLNAMAININTGKFIDPLNGLDDIKNKKISMANADTFSDDPLRMLRAISFASRFRFTIDSSTMKSIKDNAAKIREIPLERIFIEFDKILHKSDTFIAANLLSESGLLHYIFKGVDQVTHDAELFHGIRTMGEFIYLLTSGAYTGDNEVGIDNNTKKDIKALKLAFDSKDDAANIYKARSVAYNMYAVYPESLKSDIIPMPVKIACDELLSGKYPKSNADLPVNGNDLMNLGFKGEQIKNKFKEILLKIYTDKLKNNREDIIKYLNGGNSTDPNSGESIPDATSENFNLHQVSESLEQEGVGDKYAEKRFGIPNSDNEFDSKYNTHKQSSLEQPVAYVRNIDHVYNTRENVGIYKNPKSLSNFEPATRAIADFDGNIYVAQKNGSFVHEDMAKALRIGDPNGDLYVAGKNSWFVHGGMSEALGMFGNNYELYSEENLNRFSLLHRIGNTSSFGLGDAQVELLNDENANDGSIVSNLRKIKSENPQYKYYLDFYKDVTPQDTPIEEALNRPEQIKPMSNKKFIAYSAIVLDDKSKKKLYDSFANMLPEGFEFVGDHMTINFGEIDDFYKKYLGYTVRLKVESYAMDDNTMAVGVSGFGSINDKRHITIGVNKSNGATAKMSNNLKNWITYRKPLFLIGSVKEIEFKI